MSNRYQNIDQIFRKKFSDWEAGYDPSEMEEVWDGVEQQMGTQSGQGNQGNGAEGGVTGNGGSSIKSLLSGTKGWFIGSVAAAASVGGVTYMALQSDDEAETPQQKDVQETVEESPDQMSPAEENATERPFDASDETQEEKSNKQDKIADQSNGTKNPGVNQGSGHTGKERSHPQNPKNGQTQSPNQEAQTSHGGDQSSNAPSANQPVNKVHYFPAVFFQQDFMKNEQASGNRPVVLLQQQVVCFGEGLSIKTMNFQAYHKASYKKAGGSFQALKEKAELTFENVGSHKLIFKLEKDGETRLESSVIRVAPLPKADFDFEKAGYQKVRFENKSRDGGDFQWRFGDGEKSGQRQPIHYYERPGSKKVTLKVSNEYNCEDSASRNLDIEPFPEPEIPNTITPNGDGKNDKFRIKIEDEVYYYLVIKNDEGQKVFESMNKGRHWNGRRNNNGEVCKDGTYHYVFEYRYKGQEEKVTEEGRIYLKRQ